MRRIWRGRGGCKEYGEDVVDVKYMEKDAEDAKNMERTREMRFAKNIKRTWEMQIAENMERTREMGKREKIENGRWKMLRR